MAIILIVLGVALLIILSVSFIFADKIVHPDKQAVKKNPEAYGLVYENITFKTADGITLKGWLFPGRSNKIVIQTHPMGFNRAGFSAKDQGLIKMYITKTNVDLLETSRVLCEKGYSVLSFDFRSNGESDNGFTGIGLNSYQDVVAAVEYIQSRKDLAKKSIGLVSFCMGANSSIIALAKAAKQLKAIKCAILIQPISCLVFMKTYMKKVFTPLSLILLPCMNLFVRILGGYTFKQMTPLPYVKDIKIPVLYIQAKTDPWTELSDIEAMFEQTATKKPNKEFFFIEEKIDRFSAYNWVSKNPEKILTFLKKYLT